MSPHSRPSRPPVAVITGAGSGVGRACAVRLAREGWRVVLVGRRLTALEETAALIPNRRTAVLLHAADIADPATAEQVLRAVRARWRQVDALINAAGTNTPRRSLRELSLGDYHRVVTTNLHGAFYLTRVLLPALRRSPNGTIVNINSDAGLRANAKAGAAYVAAKFGLTGLAQSVAAEEGPHGVRACTIFPGDIDTPLLEKRPQPPPRALRKKMLQPDDIAACVSLILQLPHRAVVEQLVIRPRT